MTDVIYGTVKEEYLQGDRKRISYGLAAYDRHAGEDHPCILASVHDISKDQEQITRLAELCNQEKLSIVHLQDIVDDFLVNI